MTQAFRCDGCGEFGLGLVTYTLDTNFPSHGESWPKHFHNQSCIESWVTRELEMGK